MSPKVRRNNGARSYSPRSNWKSSSKWIGMTSMSWLLPLKGVIQKCQIPIGQTQEFRWCLRPKGCECLACRNGRLLTCRQGWTAFGCETCPILLEGLCLHMVGDDETKGGEESWLHLGVFQGTCWIWIVSRNFDHISRCKFRDLMNATNDNLRQYVRAYSELMLQIQHMHELDCVCQFVMGIPTWAKHKLEKNWSTSLSEAIMKVQGFSDVGRGEKSRSKKENKFLYKKPRHEGEWNWGQDGPRKEKPKQFQGLGFKIDTVPSSLFDPKGSNYVKERK